VHPAATQDQDVYGSVLLLVAVDRQGNVTDAEALTGPALLRTAAIDAVKQWKFQPVIRNAQAVSAFTSAMLSFRDTKTALSRLGAPNVDEALAAHRRLAQLESEMPRSVRQKLADLEQDSQGGEWSRRFYALNGMAKTALQAGLTDKAGSYASEVLTIAAEHRQDWNYGNAIHDGNMVLGLIALRQGDIVKAEERLLDSAASEGSPQLNSFGPNMSLAKGLLEKGERASVLEYFALCGKFWTMGRQTLETWAEDVREGRTPNFGANLLY
jgi:TonB family protein